MESICTTAALEKTSTRNQNVDCLRAGALLMVVVYHCWTLTGNVPTGIDIIDKVIPFGGDIGVTVFFMLSGYQRAANAQRVGLTY